ncbi:hypothetical protein Bca52824_081861 [Brassica carinata]|uniref:Uncharacterized protein n=1 Tax=Brassica carinata TaxID=52824 RepID=A0A8X7PI48_BRACI|nr:hypothetical protein Bca52824_081861 [Brassica carinata]
MTKRALSKIEINPTIDAERPQNVAPRGRPPLEPLVAWRGRPASPSPRHRDAEPRVSLGGRPRGCEMRATSALLWASRHYGIWRSDFKGSPS